MRYDVVGSGSTGNCTILISGKSCLIIDLGISKKRVVDALSSFGMSLEDVSGFLITHEHVDHVKYASMAPLCKIYAASKDVFTSCNAYSTKSILDDNILKNMVPTRIDRFVITPFLLSHDVKNTVGFIIDDGIESLVYVTDTGFIDEKYFDMLRNKTYYILESNYDTLMLYKSGRPYYLINRIQGDHGHIQNEDCAFYVSNFIGKKTKEVVLAHISRECNTADLALNATKKAINTINPFFNDLIIKVAKPDEEVKGGNRNDD